MPRQRIARDGEWKLTYSKPLTYETANYNQDPVYIRHTDYDLDDEEESSSEDDDELFVRPSANEELMFGASPMAPLASTSGQGAQHNCLGFGGLPIPPPPPWEFPPINRTRAADVVSITSSKRSGQYKGQVVSSNSLIGKVLSPEKRPNGLVTVRRRPKPTPIPEKHDSHSPKPRKKSRSLSADQIPMSVSPNRGESTRKHQGPHHRKRSSPSHDMGLGTAFKSMIGLPTLNKSKPAKASPKSADSAKLHNCVICMDDLPRSKVAHLSCAHYMCHDCLRRAFELSVTSPTDMPPKCCTSDEIELKHVNKLFDDKFKKLWNRKRSEYSVTNRLYCCKKGCDTWIPPKNIKRLKPQRRRQGVCPKCRTKVCKDCGKKWHDRECKDESDRIVLGLAEENGWKRCYHCKNMVELEWGCNHMTCRCGAEFCMVCGLKWKHEDCKCALFSDNIEDIPVPPGPGPPPPPPPPFRVDDDFWDMFQNLNVDRRQRRENGVGRGAHVPPPLVPENRRIGFGDEAGPVQRPRRQALRQRLLRDDEAVRDAEYDSPDQLDEWEDLDEPTTPPARRLPRLNRFPRQPLPFEGRQRDRSRIRDLEWEERESEVADAIYGQTL